MKWVAFGFDASDALRFDVFEAGGFAFAILSRSLSAMVSAETWLLKSEVERNSKSSAESRSRDVDRQIYEYRPTKTCYSKILVCAIVTFSVR